MNFIAITQTLLSREDVSKSEFLSQLCKSVTAIYPEQTPIPPWTGYLVEKDGVFVGTCAFKSVPQNSKVEIAYFTFPKYEGQGIATNMAQWLVDVAYRHGITEVNAQTLPEKNASTRILEKLKFVFAGPVSHPEDGLVWEWRKVK